MDEYVRGKRYLYIKVSNDKYELPLIVADSVVELAELDHKTTNNISSSISHNRGRYFRVEYIEDE